MENHLYWGDNLTILQEHLPDDSVDLIYLDPPFNSKRDYTVLLKSPKNRMKGSSPVDAFEDTWQWTETIQASYRTLLAVDRNGIGEILPAFRRVLGENDMMAYLVMMASRLLELHRVLKPTGSLYLHCDPTASHYLKLLLDCVFGPGNFRNEIAWCYDIGGRVSRKGYGKRHDILFFYTKSDAYAFHWDRILEPFSETGKAKFRHRDEKGPYRLMGRFVKDSPIKGHRDVSPEWERTHPHLVYRHYLKAGRMAVDFWNIPPINQASKERLGYPTQKPLALLQRIINASSQIGDVILDPFCGSGTTLHAAQLLGRHWIGIDSGLPAITCAQQRLMGAFRESVLNYSACSALNSREAELIQ